MRSIFIINSRRITKSLHIISRCVAAVWAYFYENITRIVSDNTDPNTNCCAAHADAVFRKSDKLGLVFGLFVKCDDLIWCGTGKWLHQFSIYWYHHFDDFWFSSKRQRMKSRISKFKSKYWKAYLITHREIIKTRTNMQLLYNSQSMWSTQQLISEASCKENSRREILCMDWWNLVCGCCALDLIAVSNVVMII